MIEAFEHVAVMDFLGSGEAEASVVELEVVVSSRDFEIAVVQRLIDVVHCKADEGDGSVETVDGSEQGRPGRDLSA